MHKAKFGQNSPLDWRDAKIPGVQIANSKFETKIQIQLQENQKALLTETQNNLKIQNEYFEKVSIHFRALSLHQTQKYINFRVKWRI